MLVMYCTDVLRSFFSDFFHLPLQTDVCLDTVGII